jgi:hypothetical protein
VEGIQIGIGLRGAKDREAILAVQQWDLTVLNALSTGQCLITAAAVGFRLDCCVEDRLQRVSSSVTLLL